MNLGILSLFHKAVSKANVNNRVDLLKNVHILIFCIIFCIHGRKKTVFPFSLFLGQTWE